MDDFLSEPSDAPILLGDAPMDMHDFAAPPADDFVGTVDETSADNAPIVLGGPPEDTMLETVEDDDVPEENNAMVLSGPSPMAKFNEEWQATLLERKDLENSTKADFVAQAEASLKAFLDQRESKREAKMATNRSDEQEKLEAIEADLENDNSWQRVCKMVELSHDSSDAAVDVKRMRDIMIMLKNDPNRATVLA